MTKRDSHISKTPPKPMKKDAAIQSDANSIDTFRKVPNKLARNSKRNSASRKSSDVRDSSQRRSLTPPEVHAGNHGYYQKAKPIPKKYSGLSEIQ